LRAATTTDAPAASSAKATSKTFVVAPPVRGRFELPGVVVVAAGVDVAVVGVAAPGSEVELGAVVGAVVVVLEGVTCSITVIVKVNGSLVDPSGSVTVADTVNVPAAA
jgi:hypothetical protein